MDEESRRTAENETGKRDGDARQESGKYRRRSPLRRAAVALAAIIVVCLAAVMAFRAVTGMFRSAAVTPRGAAVSYSTDKYRGTLVSTGDVAISGASDSRHGFTVAVNEVDFRKTSTRVHVVATNHGDAAVQFMANAKASLVDDQGNTYQVNPFGGGQFWGAVPVDGTVQGWLSFPPVKADAKKLSLMIPNIFDLQHPAWNVEVDFAIPGR